MRRTSKRRRLAYVVARIAIVWTLFLVALVAIWAYRMNNTRTLERMENRLLGIASSTATLVDGDVHRVIVQGTEENPAYKSLVAQLERIRRANSYPGHNIEYIYTFWRDPKQPNRVRFGLDTGVGDNHSPLNLLYEKPISPILQYVFEKGKARCEPKPIIDQWGIFRSAHAPIFDSSGRVVATLGVDLGVAKPKPITSLQIFFALTAIVVSVILGLLLARLISRAITKPLHNLMEAAAEVAQGDLQVELGQMRMHQEFSGIAAGFLEMTASLRRLVGQIGQGAELMGKWSATLKMTAEQSGRGAEEIANTMTQLATGADSVADSVGSVAVQLSKIDVLSDQVDKRTASGSDSMIGVRNSADHGVAIVASAVERAREAAVLTGKAAQNVDSFQKWSDEIAGLLEYVSDLAEQINMLSLNAQIEAARAGEHGIGFSVIAEKVGKLADDASNLVGRMAGLNEEMGARVREVGTHVRTTEQHLTENFGLLAEVKETFSEIASRVRETADLLVQTARSTNELRVEIMKGRQEVETIASVTEEEASSIEEASATAQEQAASAKEVEAIVTQLRELTERLHDEVRKFKL